ncbi:hypothetical protein [Frankia sp. EAN1pec]|uniref:hypothetical protein n=1 Tax=Parafrankia sp. (strain EAN1pec) TaxID=298653 RepID=UPI00031A32A4
MAVRRSPVDLTAVAVVGEIAVGAVAVAWQLARRQPAPHANVQMGPGGWVSLRGGRVRLTGHGRRAGHRGRDHRWSHLGVGVGVGVGVGAAPRRAAPRRRHTCRRHRMAGQARRLSWRSQTGRS